MSSETQAGAVAHFSCPECGRRYVWKSQFEGKQLGCKCGTKLFCSGGSAVSVGSGAASGASSNAPATGRAATGVAVPGYAMPRRAKTVAADEDERSVATQWVAPMILLAIGLVGRGAELKILGTAGLNIPVAVGLAFGGIVLAAVALFAGVLATAQFMGSELDEPVALVRKVLSVAAFAATVAVACASIDKEPGGIRGLLVALHVLLLLYFFCISWLMKLELLEALMATVITLGIQLGLMVAVAKALPEAAARVMFYGA